jgi:hypothetical protein
MEVGNQVGIVAVDNAGRFQVRPEHFRDVLPFR